VSFYVIGALFALIIALAFIALAFIALAFIALAFDFATPHLMHTLIHEITSAIILATIITQLFAPRRFVAGAQTLLAIFALAWLMDALTLRFSGLGLIMLGGVALAALHPARGEILALRSGVNLPLIALALVGALAFLPYALTQAAYQRNDIAPIHADLGHWEWAATLAFLLPLLAVISALRAPSALLPAWLAGLGLAFTLCALTGLRDVAITRRSSPAPWSTRRLPIRTPPTRANRARAVGAQSPSHSGPMGSTSKPGCSISL
jgi:hypothetical protein